VSFVENLTAESLNMPVDEFDQYMSGKVVPVSTWDSALLMCEVIALSLNHKKYTFWRELDSILCSKSK